MKYWASPYSWDLQLYRELGFKEFTIGNNGIFSTVELKDRRVYLGSYSNDRFTVKAWVQCEPAQFFTFSIKDREKNKTIKINTGSGDLTTYWEVVKGIIEDMIVIDVVKGKKKT